MTSNKLHTELRDPKQSKPGAAVMSDEFMASLLSENSNEPKIFDSNRTQLVNSLQTESSKIKGEQLNSPVEPCSKLICDGRTDFSNIISEINNCTDSGKGVHIPSANGVVDKQNLAVESSSNQIEEEVIPEVKEKESYRCGYESSSSDDSSSSFSLGAGSSSDCSDINFDDMYEKVKAKKTGCVKTKGEIELHDLPPIEDLHISLSEKEMQTVGKVYAIVDNLVVVHSFKDMQPLNLDSVLFLTSQKPLGRIFDVFGPVIQPFYSVRFNNKEHILERGVTEDADVFFAPGHQDFTDYVLVDQLRQQKGSDASWKDNNEPPDEFIDYSDDEQERAAKNKRRAKNRPTSKVDGEDIEVIPQKIPSVQRKQDPEIQSLGSGPNTPHAFASRTIPPKPGRSSYANIMLSKYKTGTSNNFQTSPSAYTPSSVSIASTSLPFVSHQNAFPSQAHIQQSSPSAFALRAPQPFLNPQHATTVVLQSVSPQLQSTQPIAMNYRSIPPPSPVSPSPHMQQWQQLNVRPQFVSQPMLPPASPGFPIYHQQPYIFGQVPPLGAMSAVRVSPPASFAPPTIFAVPFQPTCPSPQGFYNTVPRQIISVANWQQGQHLNFPPPTMRVEPPNTPLRIQIPPNITSPPPAIPRAYFVPTPPYHGE